MAWPATKKRRCITEIKRQRKDHGPTKALRLVSDVEGVPYKTLQMWFLKWQKQERAEAQEKEAEQVSKRRYRLSQDKAESSAGLLPIAPPPKPYLDTDGGQLKCSRCSSANHLEEVEGGFYCSICKHHLVYEPVEDVQIKYRESPFRVGHWMA